MNVKLISFTKEPVRVCASAAWGCTHGDNDYRSPESFTFSEAGDLVVRVLGRGHESIAEHASFTFHVSGLSRVTSHQLVRNRIASYAQQSQRYVDDVRDVVMPPEIDGSQFADRAREAEKLVADLYNDMVACGISGENARYFLMHGAETSITITMNAAALRGFFKRRLCLRAQWEIRAMAHAMLSQCSNVAAPLFQDQMNCDHCKEKCK
jgi:thymidylate synthase (FAD)